ncbi:hypothetical protein [Deinococcus sp. QL22]|uniref:hypothetical protein n=1 Tax=Deinococcus sp. QL22 TaxID=2939437 RepID=UPI002017E4EB|nr:hypothetical protein [Deinococcus sp. QL22]UQN10018.1 hypothetical protein M1R55_26790 [Deinococcus sp. QL22]
MSFGVRLEPSAGWSSKLVDEALLKHKFSRESVGRQEIQARCVEFVDDVWNWKPFQFTIDSTSAENYESSHFSIDTLIAYRVDDAGNDSRTLMVQLREDKRRVSGTHVDTWDWSTGELYSGNQCATLPRPTGSRTYALSHLYLIPESKVLTLNLDDFSKGQRWTKKIPAADIGYALNSDGLTGDVEVIVEKVFTD